MERGSQATRKPLPPPRREKAQPGPREGWGPAGDGQPVTSHGKKKHSKGQG